MAPMLDNISQSGRRISELADTDAGRTTELLEGDDGTRYVLWKGPRSWMDRVDSLFEENELAALPTPVEQQADTDVPSLLLECSGHGVEPFDIWKWRNLDHLCCVRALQPLAQTIKTIHDAGLTLDGIERRELIFDPHTRQLVLAAIPRLQPLDGEPETIWRDIRLFARLAYENFLEHEYPGGHQLVSLLQERTAMAETGITPPGLSQLLAGCVTPYGDLAYEDADDLLDGLQKLHTELIRPLAYRVGSRSTQGNYIFRQNNQDSCGHVVVDTTCGSETHRMGFFCVADGIGGIDDGERASALAVHTACSAFLRAWNHYDGSALRRRPGAFARAVARVTSQRLVLEGDFAPEQNRGGTTFTGLLLAGDRAGICHVGDSRAVLIRDSRPIRLTRDHTLASILKRLDQPAKSTDEDETNNRTIARFFSTHTELEWRRIDGLAEPAAAELELVSTERPSGGFSVRRGDLFLLTSDGAHGEVTEEELMRLFTLDRDTPQSLCDAIIDRSLEKVGRDNATALAVAVI